VIELLQGTKYGTALEDRVTRIEGVDDAHLRKLQVNAACKDAVVDWVRGAKIRELDSGDVAEGRLFAGVADFSVTRPKERSTKDCSPGEIRSIKTAPSNEKPLRMLFYPEHILSDSARDHLSGRRKLLVVGLVESVAAGIAQAVPIVVGTYVGNQTFRSGWVTQQARRKRTTAARQHEQWQRLYLRLRKQHPKKSNTWISIQICHDTGYKGSPETIRKNMVRPKRK
jgi:hypothetical protein